MALARERAFGVRSFEAARQSCQRADWGQHNHYFDDENYQEELRA